ncbi:hypothetical protein [Nocardia sp. NPDC005366]|uniref:hypothetical protein n=1 Tax=Nocardia sp. NPDC005366 TaxID=3156878 RepID=UPI0033A929F7
MGVNRGEDHPDESSGPVMSSLRAAAAAQPSGLEWAGAGWRSTLALPSLGHVRA